jgi:hypothetical protein
MNKIVVLTNVTTVVTVTLAILTLFGILVLPTLVYVAFVLISTGNVMLQLSEIQRRNKQ